MARYRTDPARRWALPGRIFFGHGACHILAGMFLRLYPSSGFRAKQIIPHKDHAGGHILLSNETISFDYHGYAAESRLVQHHQKIWRKQYEDWQADIRPVDFDLLSTVELN